MLKALASAAAIALTLAAYLPYLRSIRRGTAKPHVCSWAIWGLVLLVVFLAQVAGHGGVGAWPTAVTGTLTIYIALLACQRRGEVTITRADWVFFAGALLALPCWIFTADPLWAVVALTVVDVAAFGPTFRRGYLHPQSESALFFGTFVVRNTLVIVALEHRSTTTVLFPAVDALACVLLVTILLYRRQQIAARLGEAVAELDSVVSVQGEKASNKV